MPALPPYIIEPIWEQFTALLPKREVDHPLGCHRSHIPDWVVFEKLVQVLVFGCAYRRIADGSCSATTLRDRRDEWIAGGVIETLRQMALEAYDRFIGLELADVAVDSCITKAPCGGDKAGKSPVDRGKQGMKRFTVVDGKGIPIGGVTAGANRNDSPLLVPTLEHVSASVGGLPEGTSVHLDRGYDSFVTRERLQERGLNAEIAIEGPASTFTGWATLDGGEDELVAQRSQEAGVVYGARGRGHRFLGGILRSSNHRQATHLGRLDALPLGKPTSPPTLTYPRSL